MPDTKTILIAEPSAEALHSLTLGLKDAGVQNPIHSVSDGLAATQYLLGEGIYADRVKYPFPSVLLLDLELPKHNGFEILILVRDRFTGAKLLKIVLTGQMDRQLLERAYNLGANSFLSKPITGRNLKNLIAFFAGFWVLQEQSPK